MNKLIIFSIIGCFVLAGAFAYLYYPQGETNIDDELYIKNIVTEETPEKEYDKIIEVNYDNKEEDCDITKCTVADGCVC